MCIPHTRHTNTNTHRDHERTYALSAESMGVSDNRAASASDYTWGDLGCSAPAAEASGDVPGVCLQSIQGMLPGMLQTVDVTSSTGGFSHGALRPAEGEVVRLQDGIHQEAIKLDKFEALREFIKRKVAAGMDAANAGRPIRCPARSHPHSSSANNCMHSPIASRAPVLSFFKSIIMPGNQSLSRCEPH